MSSINVALLGYGTVGKGVYQSIESHQSRLKELLGKPVKIAAILVKDITKHTSPDKEVLLTADFEEIERMPHLHIVIDAIVGREPGFTYLKKSIEKGCHIITANKEMFAYHGAELLSLAKKRRVCVGYEATVAGGIPVIQTIRQLLQVNRVTKVEAILNGTSNFILSKMREEGRPFEEILLAAQENGYAEADPTNDIKGYDAFYKGMVLSQLIFGEQPDFETVERKGIDDIQPYQIKAASAAGLRFKHIVTIYKGGGHITCKAEPVLVTANHPFYQVEDVINGISIETDLVGSLQLQGPGAGKLPTASAIVEDIIQLNNQPGHLPCYKNYSKPGSNNGASKWVLFGDILSLIAFQEVKIIDRLENNVFIVEGEDISAITRTIDHIACYPLKGEYLPKAESALI